MITIFIWCILLVLHNRENMHELPVAIAIGLMVFISIVFIPIFGLTVFHVILVARGRTTNEQVTGKFQGAINPFSRDVFLNCIYALCGPRYPGLQKSSIQKDNINVNNEPDASVMVYMDNIPMDVQTKNYSKKTDFNDIRLERLDRKGSHNAANVSHSREQINRQISPNQEIQNFPNELESGVNGVKRPTESGGRHVVTMQQTENGTKETTFIALSSTAPFSSLSSKPTNNDRPGIFSYYNNKISASPSKSTSINEISSHFKRSPAKKNESQGPEGGMVIYYSPDAGVISNSKYSSESELQKFTSSTPTSQFQSDKSAVEGDYGFDSRDKMLKRPMPFLKALEISNKMEKGSLFSESQTKSLAAKDTDNRQSQYEMNHEISV